MVMPHCMDFWSFQTPPPVVSETEHGSLKSQTLDKQQQRGYHHQTSADGSKKSPTFLINEGKTFHCAQDVYALPR